MTCFCTNTDFQNQTLSCLQKSCTDADVKASQALQQQQCGAGEFKFSAPLPDFPSFLFPYAPPFFASYSPTFPICPPPFLASCATGSLADNVHAIVAGNSTASASGGANSTATATGTDASTASNTAPAGETSNAALNLNAGFSVAGVVGSGVALLGAVAGAALVL